MTDLPSALSDWIVFWEGDDQYAVTAGYKDEQEITACRTQAHDEDDAIRRVLGGRATMQESFRVWALLASDIKPRPFTVNAVTTYETELGPPFVS